MMKDVSITPATLLNHQNDDPNQPRSQKENTKNSPESYLILNISFYHSYSYYNTLLSLTPPQINIVDPFTPPHLMPLPTHTHTHVRT